MKKEQMKKITAVVIAAAFSISAGCGTDSASGGAGEQNQTAADQETAADHESSLDRQTSADAEKTGENRENEKTEIRREDYPDCDGSGHGYVEIYYSDGSMETQEY